VVEFPGIEAIRSQTTMILHDLHVHSIQSGCGLHTLLEIVDIAAGKGMKSVNVCDHGEASGRRINFGVFLDKRRFPREIKSRSGKTVTLYGGVEVNILGEDGSSDFPSKYRALFDLVSAGFHTLTEPLPSPDRNTRALENYLKRTPLDILTHPCIQSAPLHLGRVIELSLEYGFALEVNNSNLRLGKTDHERLLKLLDLGSASGARFVENSDGHTFAEIGENEKITELLAYGGWDGNALFLNRNEARLSDFIKERKGLRTPT